MYTKNRSDWKMQESNLIRSLPCRMQGYDDPCPDCPLNECAFGTGDPGDDEYERRKNNY